MHKRVFALIACALLAIGCSQEEPEGKGASRTHIVATQDELDEGIQRIDQFKQELLKGFPRSAFTQVERDRKDHS